MMLEIVDLESLDPGLPPLVRASELEIEEISVLVVSIGFEDRTSACLQLLANRNVSVDRAIVWEYRPKIVENEQNRGRLLQLLDLVGARVEYVHTFQGLTELVGDQLAEVAGVATVAVDFSTMTGRLALASIDAVSRTAYDSNVRLIALYAEADEYLPSEEEYSVSRTAIEASISFGHDEGVLKVDATANLRGSHDPQLRDLVLVVPGFSRDRVRAAISNINPTLLMSADKNVIWAISEPHLDKDRWRRDAMREIHGLGPETEVVTISTFDYVEVYRYLEQIFESEWLNSNLTIVFFGSKLQALAVGLFCSVRRGVRVVVAAPEAYRSSAYTRGVRAIWSVDFSNFPATVRDLGRVGTVQFVD